MVIIPVSFLLPLITVSILRSSISISFLTAVSSYKYVLFRLQTYTGSILIAVNPFKKLPHLYNGHMMEQYKGAPFGELSPHVFAVSDVAYRWSTLFSLMFLIFLTLTTSHDKQLTVVMLYNPER